VSSSFGKSRALAIETTLEQLEFADRSIGYTSGLVRATVSVVDFSDVRRFLLRGDAIDMEFYVLESLDSDILLDQDTIEELGIYIPSFVARIRCIGETEVNIIRHIGRLEHSVSEKLKKLRNAILGVTPQTSDDTASIRRSLFGY